MPYVANVHLRVPSVASAEGEEANVTRHAKNSDTARVETEPEADFFFIDILPYPRDYDRGDNLRQEDAFEYAGQWPDWTCIAGIGQV